MLRIEFRRVRGDVIRGMHKGQTQAKNGASRDRATANTSPGHRGKYEAAGTLGDMQRLSLITAERYGGFSQSSTLDCGTNLATQPNPSFDRFRIAGNYKMW